MRCNNGRSRLLLTAAISAVGTKHWPPHRLSQCRFNLGTFAAAVPIRYRRHQQAKRGAQGLTIHSSRTRFVAAIFQGKSFILIAATKRVGLIQALGGEKRIESIALGLALRTTRMHRCFCFRFGNPWASPYSLRVKQEPFLAGCRPLASPVVCPLTIHSSRNRFVAPLLHAGFKGGFGLIQALDPP